MNYKDIIGCGLQDLRTQRKRNRISFFLLFMSLVLYIGVNSTMKSIDRGVYDSMNGHYNRLLYNPGGNEWEENYDFIVEKYGNDERVEEIFTGAIDLFEPTLKWIDVESIFGVEYINPRVGTFYNAVLTSDCKGEIRKPEYGEIILPRYIYDEGIYNEYTCYDCDELIGKTITFSFNPFEMGKREYKFKVIGTYDNITKVTMYNCYMNPEQMREMLDFYFDTRNTWIDEQKEAGVDIGNTKRKGYGIYMVIRDGYDIDKVAEEMHNEVFSESNENIFLNKQLQRSEEIASYNKYIQYTGNVVSFMCLVVAIMNILISAIREVKDRAWEFSLKMAMGYRRKDVILIFTVEKLANTIKAFVVSIITLLLYSGVLTYYYRNMEVYWKRDYNITIEMADVIVALFLAFLASMMGVVLARFLISNINITKNLRKGE